MGRIETAAEVIQQKCGTAEIGLVLGSGLADTIQLENPVVLPYSEIPGFPISTAQGHKSEWVFGTFAGKKVCMMRGRFHYYEGYSLQEVILPIRVMKLLGVKTIILTNAAGGVNEGYTPGDLMLIEDVINFSGINPLIGKNEDAFGPRFPDMTNAMTPALRDLAKSCAKECGFSLQEGVYMWFSGPSYETAAEIRMARILGADAVGMSTVPEVIAARHCGMDILGISSITNMGTGVTGKALSHKEVMENGQKIQQQFAALLKLVIEKI